MESKNKFVACVGHKYLRYFDSLDEALEAQKKAQQEDQDAVIAEPAKKRSMFYDPDDDDFFDEVAYINK